MPNCMLCGKSYILAGNLRLSAYFDGISSPMQICKKCYGKLRTGKWCAKHRCCHETITGAEPYEGCLQCLAEEKKAALQKK